MIYPRITHTYVTLDVTESTYQEVKKKLLDAGYSNAINDNGDIDMHGIALVSNDNCDKPKNPCGLLLSEIEINPEFRRKLKRIFADD